MKCLVIICDKLEVVYSWIKVKKHILLTIKCWKQWKKTRKLFYKKTLNLSNETFLILNWRLQIITSSRKEESWRSPERERPSRCVRTSWGGSKRISDRDSSRSRRPQSCTRRTGLRSSGFSRILRGCSGRPRGGRRICRKTRWIRRTQTWPRLHLCSKTINTIAFSSTWL